MTNFQNVLKYQWENFNKTCTKHPLVMGSQVCSNEGPCPFKRGDNNQIAKINNLTRPIQSILAQSILGWMGIQFGSYEGPCLFPRGDIYEIEKIHWQSLKDIFLQKQLASSSKLGTKHFCLNGIRIVCKISSSPGHR